MPSPSDRGVALGIEQPPLALLLAVRGLIGQGTGQATIPLSTWDVYREGLPGVQEKPGCPGRSPLKHPGLPSGGEGHGACRVKPRTLDSRVMPPPALLQASAQPTPHFTSSRQGQGLPRPQECQGQGQLSLRLHPSSCPSWTQGCSRSSSTCCPEPASCPTAHLCTCRRRAPGSPAATTAFLLPALPRCPPHAPQPVGHPSHTP